MNTCWPGATVYVVSASIEEWVRPWCYRQGVKDVLCTKAEIGSDGRLTGQLKGPNCYGQEKVNRLLEVEPRRQSYTLHAYGDSRGDRELMAIAEKARNQWGRFLDGRSDSDSLSLISSFTQKY